MFIAIIADRGDIMVERTKYLEKLNNVRNKQIIKIITGMRRCGKSTLLMQYRDKLLADGIRPEQIIEINFEDLDFEELLNYKSLYNYVGSRLLPETKMYILLDEIQLVKDFQKAVNSLFLNINIDLYITGSNAYMLSGELATLLSGRYIEINMLPLSFQEYFNANPKGGKTSYTYSNTYGLNSRQIFSNYINTSSLPYALQLENEQVLNDYLSGIINTVLLKDVMQRNKMSNPALLNKIMKYVAENIGNMISPNKIADTLTSSNMKTTGTTIENYLKALEDSFILYKASRYDIRGKEHLKTLCKYYIADIGLRNNILGKKNPDIGRILENVVYLELLRRDYTVNIGKLNKTEIDFVAKTPNETLYIQVAASSLENETLERELRPLYNIKDNYKKMLLTLDEISSDYDGIEKKNLVDWLLGG